MAMILVTGGAGFIGSHVCQQLLDRGDTVICIDNFDDYYNPETKEKNIKDLIKNPNFKLYKVDIVNLETLNNIFKEKKIKKIIHLAAKVGVRYSIENPWVYEEVNIKGTINLLELAKDHNIDNFIFGSSSSVYGTNEKLPFSEEDKVENPISPYAASKRADEVLCSCYHDLYNLNITCLRFFTVYGPRNRPDMALYKFTDLINNNQEIEMYGDGSSKRDYTYVMDVVNGIISALDKNFEFEIINLGNSKTTELKQLISLIEEKLGKKAKIKTLPMQKGDVPITYANINKAKRLLDYEPKVSIEEGINLLIGWYKNER